MSHHSRTLIALIMLLLATWASVVPSPLPEVASSSAFSGGAEPAGGTLVDHGDGTATFTVVADGSGEMYDTWLSAAQPTTNFGSDAQLKVGYSNNDSSRWTALFGIDLDTIGLWTNVSIHHAELELHSRHLSGTPVVRSWVCYESQIQPTWEEDSATWQGPTSTNTWEVGGALGIYDSGGLMDEVSITSQLNFTSFDVTRAIDLAHHRRYSSDTEPASILLTGPAWDDEWVTFDSVDYVFASERPRLNITFSWGTPSSLPTSTEWVDIYPKEPYRIDADSQLTLEAFARSGQADVIGGTTSWSTNIGSIDAGGQFTPDVTGVAKIEAIVDGMPGEMDLQVTAGTPVSLKLAPLTASITVDDNLSFSASLEDAHGNQVEGAALTWHADVGVIDNDGFYLPAAVGDDVVTVMWQSLYASADITVSAGAAANITFEYGLTVAAGEQLPLVYSVTDWAGNPLPNGAAGAISWSAENGHIDGVGIYTGDAVGSWIINATSTSGAAGHTYVEVSPGALADISLLAPNGSQPADQPVLLIVEWLDVRGNRVPVRIPLSNWTAEDGNFRMTPGGVEWLPRREGNWTVGVHVEDIWVNATIWVVHGNASRLLIVTDSEVISADDVAELELHAEDDKGNRWLISGIWTMMEPEAAPWLYPSVEGATFEGVKSGIWTIKAEHDGPDGVISAFLMLEVIPGSLARIELEGHGRWVSADGSHDFSPNFFDEDDNQVGDILLNWTFRHNGVEYDRTGDLRSNDAVWYPVLAGHHEVEVEAGGVFAAIGIDIDPGIPHTLRVLIDGVLTVRSGDVYELRINATDLDGNDFGSDVSWDLPLDSVDMANGSREGVYLLKGLREGSHLLRFTAGLAEGQFTVIVEKGDSVRIELVLSYLDLKAGEKVDVEVRVFDFGGNRISTQPENVTISSSAGTLVHDSGDHWEMALEESGEQQRIQVVFDSVSGEIFIDVKADPLYAFGDSSLATSLWGGIAGVTLLFVLLIALLRTRSRREEEAMESLYEPEVHTSTSDLSGYKPSKKARKAARDAFHEMQMKHQPSGYGQWGGYQQAQQWSQQPEVQQAVAAQLVATAAAPEPQQVPAELEDEQWTTEQIWSWGRSQGWPEEQIAQYEETYELAVRQTGQQPVADPFDGANSTTQVQEPVAQPAEFQVEAEVPPEPIEKPADIREKGVMKAMPGTTQGESGWYLDGEGNPSRWEIDDDGAWHRTG